MTLTRRILACAVVAVLTTAVFGAAATLGVTAHSVGADSAVVADCDTGGITVDYTGDPGPVTALVVSGLASACNGGKAWATVSKTDGSSPVSSTTAATVSGGQVTINLATSALSINVQRYHVVVVSP